MQKTKREKILIKKYGAKFFAPNNDGYLFMVTMYSVKKRGGLRGIC